MKKIDDILLIQLAEGSLEGEQKAKVEKLIKTNISLKKKYNKYRRTILILKKFGNLLEKTKQPNTLSIIKPKPKISKSTNIIEIAEFLAKQQRKKVI